MLLASAAIVIALALGSPVSANAACEESAGNSRTAEEHGAPSLYEILTRLQQHYDCTRSFRAKFTEEISSPGGMKQSRSGMVYFQKVGRMRWEFDPPRRETIVSDGKFVYDYEPDLNQVVEVPVNKAFKTSATAFLLGLGNVKSDFNAKLPTKPRTDGLVHVLLTPKGGGDTMELGLDPRSYNIVNFTLTDQIGDVTRLKFSNIQTNVALESSLFTFTAPPGADIVTPG
jgi:outer membrane lipoprotein carrier protein